MLAIEPTGAGARAADCLAGGGNMGALMRALDWSRTPVGPVEQWPQSLRTAVSTILASGFPMLVVWGPEHIQFYNDAYRPVLGATKHPAALGQRAGECWPEIWPNVLQPMFQQVLSGGEAIWSEDMLFLLDRNGYLEETFFTFSYSAIRDETGFPGGILVTCVETTGRVLAERRLRTLRELAAHASTSQSVDEACRRTAETLAHNRSDVPFALVYLADGTTRLHLAGTVGMAPGTPFSAPLVDLGDGHEPPWPLGEVLATNRARTIAPIAVGSTVVDAPWPEPPHTAVAVPIAHPGSTDRLGVLVAGISLRRALDADYQGFLDLIAGHLATAIGNARAYEAERRRAEALAELDRAKTTFFSNVSHEFRTPLTLLLGPMEQALAAPGQALAGESLHVAHRNALRLLRLVNTLLDFSRIEAGRVQASYRRTDVSALTRDLAGAFRSTIEQAGLRFTVDCEPIEAPVFVDRDMWEKIVLNLVSNAFKFTFEGEVAVRLRAQGDRVELEVRDTGVGIPDSQIPHLFERFHRVEGARSRTHEGSGIGLALIHELVRLHGGAIAVSSRVDAGSTFTVSLPIGHAHLPAERVQMDDAPHAGARHAAAYVEEADRWRPGEPAPAVPRVAGERILVADDNADMRDYLRQLLGATWQVEVAADGEEAVEMARRAPPDLVVADVMMPRLDGFGLLRALRADARTRGVPVLMLSARAGEEARVEGLSAGADDYVIKPFGARELLARVQSLLNLSRARHEADLQKQHLRSLFMQAPTPMVILRGPDHVIELANPLTCRIWGRSEAEVVGRPLLEALPELVNQPFKGLLDGVLQSGAPYVGKETPAHFDRGDGSRETVYFNFVYAPLRGVDGAIEGILVIAFDITDELAARNEMNRLRAAAEAASRTKDEFLAMLGHELRNPLAPILTALQLMSLRGDVRAEREREIIDRQVRHLVRLVDDLLDVSRIARGQIELKHTVVELAEIVASAIETSSPLLEERRHRLEVDVPQSGLAVSGDVTRLTQIVMNLLSNAAKYTEPRGTIRVRARAADGHAELRVKDDGIGISPAMLPRVFDMFAQERQAADRSQGGLGLGLTIVRNMATLHGGTVEARSDGVGKGSEFIVRLPLVASAAPDAAASHGVTAAARTGGRKVLVVDDNVDAATLTSEALAALGHETRVAYDGLAAVAAAAAFQPEVALLDLGLPLMDGYQVAATIRAASNGAPPVLIAVTGYGQDSDRERAAAAGFRAHLVKPVDLAVLTKLLDELPVAGPRSSRERGNPGTPTGPRP